MKHKTSAAKPAHTPLPWTEDPEGEHAIGIEGANGSLICHVSQADATLITDAVNSHANLVAALTRAETMLNCYVNGDKPEEMCAYAEALADVQSTLKAAQPHA